MEVYNREMRQDENKIKVFLHKSGGPPVVLALQPDKSIVFQHPVDKGLTDQT